MNEHDNKKSQKGTSGLKVYFHGGIEFMYTRKTQVLKA